MRKVDVVMDSDWVVIRSSAEGVGWGEVATWLICWDGEVWGTIPFSSEI